MSVLTAGFLAILILYISLFILYRIGWSRLRASSQRSTASSSSLKNHFSIIIPARNEAHQITQTLQSILDNQYPHQLFQIIVVDDFSEDDTARRCQELLQSAKGEHLVLQLEQELSPAEAIIAYKKKALEIGIKHSKGTHLITTDADCIVTPNWLETINSVYTNHPSTQFVIAPVNFIPYDKKNSLYYFQSIDFLTMQGITAASYQLRIGNMCNGANLSFTKEAFEAVDGYINIDNLASGDDMMLYNKIAQQFPNAIQYASHPQAMVHTPVQPTWSSFLQQRIRWASKNGKYNDFKLTSMLLVVYLFNVSLLSVSIWGLFNWTYLPYISLLWLSKILAELLIVIPVSKYFNKQQEWLPFVLLQPLHCCYIVAAGFLGWFKQYKWKGRRVH